MTNLLLHLTGQQTGLRADKLTNNQKTECHRLTISQQSSLTFDLLTTNDKLTNFNLLQTK